MRRPSATLKKGPLAQIAANGLDVEFAEKATDIKHQQVSRWAKGLKDEAKYRAAARAIEVGGE